MPLNIVYLACSGLIGWIKKSATFIVLTYEFLQCYELCYIGHELWNAIKKYTSVFFTY